MHEYHLLVFSSVALMLTCSPLQCQNSLLLWFIVLRYWYNMKQTGIFLCLDVVTVDTVYLFYLCTNSHSMWQLSHLDILVNTITYTMCRFITSQHSSYVTISVFEENVERSKERKRRRHSGININTNCNSLFTNV